MKKYVFLDFNGTVLNDVELCFNILNEMLDKRNKQKVTMERYKEIFTFPIIEYYKLAGLEFETESFSDMAIEFIGQYQSRSLIECEVYDDFFETMDKLKSMGVSVVLCSASKYSNLIEQTNHFKITELFDDIIGLDDIHAISKKELAMDFIVRNNIDCRDVVFIGDTDHDLEVSKFCNCDAVLVSSGHQSMNVLKNATNNCCVRLSEIFKFLD